MRKIICFLLAGVFLISVTGCRWLNPSIMFKTGRGYNYSQFKDSTGSPEYRISPNDVLSFQLYAKDGFALIDISAIGQQAGGSTVRLSSGIEYIVDHEGYAKLPILNRVNFKGMTTREAEQMLEKKYVDYYNDPFAIVRVTNRRVIIFPGQAGSAKVVPLTNNNITLLEALALSGGISQNGKAKRVKLIRGDLQHPEVYLIDLSTIDGIKKADLVLQANDIIYVEPRLNITQEFLGRMSPVIGVITSFLFIYYLVKNPPQ